MLATSAYGQQIASADLTHPNILTTHAGKNEHPSGCEGFRPRAIGDGFVETPNQESREIVVEMVQVTNQAPSIGSIMRGEARIRNSGVHPIQIPWSIDSIVKSKGSNPRDSKTGIPAVDWEEGSFNVVLEGSGVLKSLTQPLFSSKSVAGSQITIGPGEVARQGPVAHSSAIPTVTAEATHRGTPHTRAGGAARTIWSAPAGRACSIALLSTRMPHSQIVPKSGAGTVSQMG